MPEISVIRGEGATLVTLEEEKSLLSLPEKEQIKIIKSHFPRIGREERFLIKLMEKNATSRSNAIKLKKTGFIRKMLKLERINETKDGIYLTELGYRIAKGARKIYGKEK